MASKVVDGNENNVLYINLLRFCEFLLKYLVYIYFIFL